MRVFLSYIYKIKLWIIIAVVEILFMSGILILNNTPSAEVIYGAFLLLFIILAAVIYGYYRYCHRYKYLKMIAKNIELFTEALPVPEDCIEEEYQQLIKSLAYYYNGILNKNSKTFKDMDEYYTMWVHQIKTPIAAMKLLLQEKSTGYDVSYEYTQLFKIEQYAEMALQYMRLGSESTDFVIETVDVHSVVKEAVHKYARMFIQKKIKLDFKDFDVQVISDEKWLEFVIEQILSNAVKYTNKGYVYIYVEKKECIFPDDGITYKETALVIEDTGIGINNSDLPRICEKGYTGYNGHDDKLSTGIGLYLCNEILKKLSHKIKIESEEGKGTKAKILFYVKK